MGDGIRRALDEGKVERADLFVSCFGFGFVRVELCEL